MKQSMKSKGFERRLLLIMWGLFLSLSAFAQQISIKGHVVDATGEPVIGASVVEGRTTNGTITDVDGNFSLSVPANSTLTISFVGYKTQTVPVNGKNSLKVTLQEDTEVLDEVVVVGYGTMKKSDLTGAVSSVGVKDIKDSPVANIGQAMQGKVSGVQIIDAGKPGDNVTIKIRGLGTINTFFIFFSDNGTAGVPGSSSGPLRGHKFDEWDGGVHAPAVLYWKKAEKQYKNLSSQVTGFVDLVPTLKDLVGDHSRPKREYDGISILPVLNGKKACIDRDFYLGHGAVVNKDYKLIRKGMKPGLDLKQDFLVDYKTDPYEKKNASAGNEKIVKALYEVALKYDTITPCIPEVPYGKGRDGFKAPKEWKVVR